MKRKFKTPVQKPKREVSEKVAEREKRDKYLDKWAQGNAKSNVGEYGT